MTRFGTRRTYPIIELDRFTATDDAGRKHTVRQMCEPFQMFELAGWSDMQHTVHWLECEGVRVTPDPDGTLWTQTQPPARLHRR